MEIQKTPNSQSNLEKEEWNWKINLPDFRLYYKATVIETLWYWHKDRNKSLEQNRKPRDKSMILWTPIFDTGGKNIQWRKDNLFNKWCWENWSTTSLNGGCKDFKAKINKWDLIKLKSFCTTKETISRVKRQPSEWEKIIANEATDN